MNSYQPADENLGVLERKGIAVQTTPPEHILTAGKAKSIRFRVSRPHGYAYGDVESYQYDYVIPTLEWYAQTLHQRDLEVHALGEEMDRLEIDLANTKAQLDNKDYNEAVGLAVEEYEKDSEAEVLLIKLDSLQAQLDEANRLLEAAHATGYSNPEGTETYTREEVESFLQEAYNSKDAEYAGILVEKDNEYTILLDQSRREAAADKEQAVRTAVANAEAAKDQQYALLMQAQENAAQANVGYTQEELDNAIASAVESARGYTQEELDNAIASAVENARGYTQEELDRAVASAAEQATGYTQEEMENAIAAAVAAKEEEILARIPEASSIDEISELTNEGDMKYRAENKTLKKSLEELDTYCKQLESYIAEKEGTPVAQSQQTGGTSPLDTPMNDGRALPKLRPEDL